MEFTTTINELTDIPNTAIQGLSKPITAKGNINKLYPIAQPIFCMILDLHLAAIRKIICSLARSLSSKTISADDLAK